MALVCPFCGSRFGNLGALKQHVMSKHINFDPGEPLYCPVCSTPVASLQGLLSHCTIRRDVEHMVVWVLYSGYYAWSKYSTARKKTMQRYRHLIVEAIKALQEGRVRLPEPGNVNGNTATPKGKRTVHIRADGEVMVVVSFRAPRSLVDRIDAVARAMNVSRSEVIRRAVEQYVNAVNGLSSV